MFVGASGTRKYDGSKAIKYMISDSTGFVRSSVPRPDARAENCALD